jgi:Metallo-beta-lactamase superfamily
MPRAQEVQEVSPGILVWQAYDSKVKADLFSTALETPAGSWLVDPVPLEADGVLTLSARAKAAGVVVTNANHTRAAVEFAAAFSTDIYVSDHIRESADFPQATGVRDGEMFSAGLTAVGIDGGPAGEMALHYEGNGGTMIVGDALINFEPHGFGLLPAKYCLDARLMRRSLSKLLDYDFERMLFAHGTPILSTARTRLAELLTAIR